MCCMFMIFMLIEGRDVVKKNAESSGGVGEKPTKSEDDVFSDAVMNFSDGTSPQLEEHSESVRESGLPKSLEQKSMDRDLYGSGVLELDVEEAAGKHVKGLVLFF